MGVFDVPAGLLIEEIAKDFKAQGIKQPLWAKFVKTGMSKERVPDNREWFYSRMGSILYRIMKDGPVGTGGLRTYYGGRKNRGCKKEHFYKAGGKIIRVCLQNLEKQGLIEKHKKGRVVSAKGQSYLAKKAKETAALVVENNKRKDEIKAEKAQKRKEKETEEAKRVEEDLRKIDSKQKGKGKPGEEKAKGKHEHKGKEGKQAVTAG